MVNTCYCSIEHINIGVIILIVGNSQRRSYATQSNYDWLSITQSDSLQGDWLILENNEKATLQINMPY